MNVNIERKIVLKTLTLKLSADEAKTVAQFLVDAVDRGVKGYGIHVIRELQTALQPYLD
jgi:LDH2 family malate/lactate/ureidoglycolate dehydrogenase